MAQSESVGIVFLLLQHVVLFVELGEPWMLLDLTKAQSLLRVCAEDALKKLDRPI